MALRNSFLSLWGSKSSPDSTEEKTSTAIKEIEGEEWCLTDANPIEEKTLTPIDIEGEEWYLTDRKKRKPMPLPESRPSTSSSSEASTPQISSSTTHTPPLSMNSETLSSETENAFNFIPLISSAPSFITSRYFRTSKEECINTYQYAEMFNTLSKLNERVDSISKNIQKLEKYFNRLQNSKFCFHNLDVKNYMDQLQEKCIQETNNLNHHISEFKELKIIIDSHKKTLTFIEHQANSLDRFIYQMPRDNKKSINNARDELEHISLKKNSIKATLTEISSLIDAFDKKSNQAKLSLQSLEKKLNNFAYTQNCLLKAKEEKVAKKELHENVIKRFSMPTY